MRTLFTVTDCVLLLVVRNGAFDQSPVTVSGTPYRLSDRFSVTGSKPFLVEGITTGTAADLDRGFTPAFDWCARGGRVFAGTFQSAYVQRRISGQSSGTPSVYPPSTQP